MTSTLAFLHNIWAGAIKVFQPMPLDQRISSIAIGLLLALALFQMVRHSVLRYYLMVLAMGVSISIGYVLYRIMANYVLPKFLQLDPSQSATVAIIVGTTSGLFVGLLLFWPILKPRTTKRTRRSKKTMKNLATPTGTFGNTQAGSSDPNWKSDRAHQEDVIDSFRPGGRIPTNPEAINELLRRRTYRDQRPNR